MYVGQDTLSVVARCRPFAAEKPLVITTSWDDGHPCDLELAELLQRYGLAATFYAPRMSQRETLPSKQVRVLAENFEIGAHTVDHWPLTSLPDVAAKRQVAESKAWVEDITGKECTMFCPPQGMFFNAHVRMLEDLGFRGYRTVEMGATTPPRQRGRCLELPTTVQAHPHPLTALLRNALRRRRWSVALYTLRNLKSSTWSERAHVLLSEARAAGGVFHLWGHSWEIHEHHQWRELEGVLQTLAELVEAGLASTCTNGELCQTLAAS